MLYAMIQMSSLPVPAVVDFLVTDAFVKVPDGMEWKNVNESDFLLSFKAFHMHIKALSSFSF